MTTATAPRSLTPGAVPGVDRAADHHPALPDVAAATAAVSRGIGAVPAADARWTEIGPLVTALADAVRSALGAPGAGTLVGVPPILRQRDLAVAARGLLHRDARIRDGRAAVTASRLAGEILATV